MKIEQINIENFRCFKGNQSFDINGQTVILYGENGYGKSSFFDAIEWCLTGNVDRFRKPGERNLDKNIIINRLASVGESCSVELKIEGIILRRFFNIVEKPRESIVIRDAISNNIIVQGKENVENYINEKIAHETTNRQLFNTLMKKSHILSQDQITDFVLKDDPKDRFDSLADIMGYRQLINLTNNLKKVRDHLNNNVKRQNNIISTYKEVVQSKKSEKLEVNILDIRSILKYLEIDIDPDNPIVVDEINAIEGELSDKLGSLIQKKTQIEKLSNDIKDHSYSELKSEKSILKNEMKISFERKKRIESLLNRISEENKLILKNKSARKNQEKIFEEREEIIKEISNIENSISNSKIIEQEVEDLIKKEEFKNQELLYSNTHWQSYNKSLLIKKRAPIQIKDYETHIDRFNWRLKNARKYFEIFQQCFSDENEHTSLSSLNHAIQDIYKYVIENKVSTCPVCLTNKGSNLPSIISKNFETNLYEISLKSSKVSKLNEILKRVNYKISYLEKEKIKAQESINELKININFAEENLSYIQNSTFFNKEIFGLDYEKIEQLLNLSSTEINTLKNYKIQFYNLNSLKNKLKNLKQKNIETDLKKHNAQNNRIFTLKQREKILNVFVAFENENINTKQKKHEELSQNIFLLSKILFSAQEHLQIKTLIFNFEEEISKSEYRMKKIQEVRDFSRKIENNNKIEENIKNFEKIILEKEKRLEICEDELRIIDQHRKNIFSEIGSEASELLNNPNSSIQKYFRYLNPVPSVNKVLFNSPSSEELDIVLKYDHEQMDSISSNNSNVQYSLSSGQLYVLAISIFLAINESQNVSKLSFLGIDDPIQNMDDVNQFSICDVLSSINKQLFFSTHDFDFLKLFLKKNEHKKENIQVFMLEHDDYSVTKIKEVNFVTK